MADDSIDDDIDVEPSDDLGELRAAPLSDKRQLQIRRQIEQRQELRRLRDEWGFEGLGLKDLC